MSCILMAWELGSGLGHVGPLRAVGAELAQRGHRVIVAAPNVQLCRQGFAGTAVEVAVCPVVPPSDRRLKFPCTYSDTLHDCGYSSAEALASAVGQWLALLDELKPRLLLAEHSPTAMLAARLRPFPLAAIGTGFVCPPDLSPLPSLRPEIPEPHWADEVERNVLSNMNAALGRHDGKPLERVSSLFGAADRTYLRTDRELDHYARWRVIDPEREGYWPPFGALPGLVCDWPTGPNVASGPRVFVYLRDNAVLGPILRGLAYKRYPTVAYAARFTPQEEAEYYGTSVRLERSPVDLPSIAETCDAAVLHGGHGTVRELLHRGVPMAVLPMSLEQRVTGERLAELGVGVCAPLDHLDQAASALEQVLTNPKYRQAAHKLIQRLPELDEQSNVSRLAADIEVLLQMRENMPAQAP